MVKILLKKHYGFSFSIIYFIPVILELYLEFYTIKLKMIRDSLNIIQDGMD